MRRNDKDKEETRITERDNTAKSAATVGSGLAFIFLAILSAISTRKIVAIKQSDELEKVTYNNIVSDLERELKLPESKPEAIRKPEYRNIIENNPELKLAEIKPEAIRGLACKNITENKQELKLAEIKPEVIRGLACKNITETNPEFEKMFDRRIYYWKE